jgi:hypothetical protein
LRFAESSQISLPQVVPGKGWRTTKIHEHHPINNRPRQIEKQPQSSRFKPEYDCGTLVEFLLESDILLTEPRQADFPGLTLF